MLANLIDREGLTAHFEDCDQTRRFKAAKVDLPKDIECKQVPNGPKSFILCCNQIIGCLDCLNRCLRENPVCPLCRSENPKSVVVNGMNSIYSCCCCCCCCFFMNQTTCSI